MKKIIFAIIYTFLLPILTVSTACAENDIADTLKSEVENGNETERTQCLGG